MNISLRAGEKLYINGAVIRVDRKVTIELMNDVTFLLESHVLQAEDAKTPLRQLYFYVQTMLMDPDSAANVRALVATLYAQLLVAFKSEAIVAGLKVAGEQVDRQRYFEALRTIRALYPLEAELLAGGDGSPIKAA